LQSANNCGPSGTSGSFAKYRDGTSARRSIVVVVVVVDDPEVICASVVDPDSRVTTSRK
jgi:hypothetical protein